MVVLLGAGAVAVKNPLYRMLLGRTIIVRSERRRNSGAHRRPAGSAAESLLKGGRLVLRMRVHDKEPIGMALRRFKKLIERSGMQKELRAHQHYEKPSEQRRRARVRKEKAARKARGQV